MTNNTDSRTVHTDALATLGTIIGPNEKRDAIHLAVMPMQSTTYLTAGTHVDKDGQPAIQYSSDAVGLVDPFLRDMVRPGDWFWLVIYPRVITSLRHVWTHPAFEDEVGAPDATVAEDQIQASRDWIAAFAVRIDQTVNSLMEAAERWLHYRDYTLDNTEAYKGHWDEFPEFWHHYAIVTGTDVPEEEREEFFRCSC